MEKSGENQSQDELGGKVKWMQNVQERETSASTEKEGQGVVKERVRDVYL